MSRPQRRGNAEASVGCTKVWDDRPMDRGLPRKVASPRRAAPAISRDSSTFPAPRLAIFDSGAICDHLETLSTIRLIPEQGSARRAALRLQMREKPKTSWTVS
jgi:hypothetical protein